MKLSAILFLLFVTLSNTFAKISPKRVVVTGKVINGTASTPKVFGVNFLNPFDNTRKSAVLNAKMEFSVEEKMLFTQNMTIAYNDVFINLYTVPGDSVHLEIDASLLGQPNFKWLKISGDHSKMSTQLNLIHHFVSKLDYHKYDYSVSVPVMLEDVKRDYKRYLDYLYTYAKISEVDPVVIDFFKRDIKYGISNSVADYVDSGKNSTSTRAERIALFKDAFFQTGNDSNFVSMMYPYHIEYYMSWKTKGDSSILRAIKLKDYSRLVQLGTKIILAEPASISRDYMLLKFANSYLEEAPELAKEIPSLKRYFSDPSLFAYLVLMADRAAHVSVEKTVVSSIEYLDGGKISSADNADVLAMLAKKYPNKVIYLDVYATWCAPCLKEMEFAPAIHRRFAGKDVVFVNLCLQSTAANWVKLARDKKLSGENYFLGDDDSKLLMGNFNIRGFPTYLLVDRRGKVKTVTASKPSESEKLGTEIQNLLNQ